jgi:hypothetical protein
MSADKVAAVAVHREGSRFLGRTRTSREVGWGYLTNRCVLAVKAPYRHQLKMDRKNLLRGEDFDRQPDYSVWYRHDFVWGQIETAPCHTPHNL